MREPLKRNVLVGGFALRVIERVVALIDRLRSLRGFSRLGAVPVLGRPEEPERGDDYFRHVMLLALTILVTAQLEPSFDVEKLAFAYKLSGDFSPATPGNTTNPERVGLFLSVGCASNL